MERITRTSLVLTLCCGTFGVAGGKQFGHVLIDVIGHRSKLKAQSSKIGTFETRASAVFCDADHVAGTSDVAGLDFKCGGMLCYDSIGESKI